MLMATIAAKPAINNQFFLVLLSLPRNKTLILTSGICRQCSQFNASIASRKKGPG
jgi:hypothetical protein